MNTTYTNEQIEAAGHDIDNADKVRALCEFLGCEPDDIKEGRFDHYGLTVFECGSQEYSIGTDAEADEAAQKAISDSAWAFNASFLASFCELPEKVFEAMQGECEGCNDDVLSLIEKSGGISAFAQDAISADGRGHFLSGYDGDENEQGDFYIYRTN
jgi:hypothetical protein